MIRLAAPDIDAADLQAVEDVLKTGYLVQGPQVRQFEAKVASLAGVEHGIAVSNCTAALHLALVALNVGPGDRVAVPTFSWPATANVVVLVGAEPVFVDIESCTYAMDPHRLAAALEADRAIKAVILVHALGAMGDVTSVADLTRRHHVHLIEDAACALGAHTGERPAGSWGTIGCFSFHPRKAITTGEGGVIATRDVSLARKMRALRNHGLDPDGATPDFIMAGYNLRMTDFQAALGLQQLAKVERLIQRRRDLADRYTRLFDGSALTPPRERPGSRHVFQTYAVLLPPDAAARRQEIIAALRERGIETTIATYHIPLTRFFRARGRYAPGTFPVTDDIAGRGLALPLHSRLSDQDQERVARELLELL